MKKILLFSLLFSLFSNNHTFSQKESSTKQTELSFFDMNNNQVPLLLHTKNFDDNLWALDLVTVSINLNLDIASFVHFKKISTYDEKGNPVQVRQKRLENSESAPPAEELSMEWTDVSDSYYYWNNSQKLDSAVIYKTNNGSGWEKDHKYIYMYDNRGNEINRTGFRGENGEWMTNYQSLSTFDGSGNILSETLNYGDGKNGWKTSSIVNYIYDDNGNLLRKDGYVGDNQTIAFGNKYTYGNMGNLLSDSLYNVEENYCEKTTYQYDENGNVLTKTVMTSVNPFISWDSISNEILSYNEMGLMETSLCYRWRENYVSKDEVLRERYISYHNTYQYDENNILIKRYIKATDEVKDGLIEKIFDENYNLLEECHSYRESESNDWIAYHRFLREYDEYKNCIEVKSLRLNTFTQEWTPWNEAHYFTFNNGKSESSVGEVWRGEFTYRKRNTTSNIYIEDISGSINVFPNPVNDYVNISLKLNKIETVKVRIYDLSGKLILQLGGTTSEGTITKSINMSNLSKGVYLVHIIIGDKTVCKKIIKK